MIQFLLALIFCFSYPVSLHADGRYYAAPAAAGGLTCTTSDDTDIVTMSATSNQGYAVTASAWVGGKFSKSSAFRITEYSVRIYDDNDTGSVTVSLYNDSGGNPGTEIADSAATVAASAMTNGNYVDYNFTLATPLDVSPVGATTYHVVVKGVSGFSGYAHMQTPGSVANQNFESTTNSGSSWTQAADDDMRGVVRGCE